MLLFCLVLQTCTVYDILFSSWFEDKHTSLLKQLSQNALLKSWKIIHAGVEEV